MAKKKQTGLGRSFDSLIPQDIIQEEFDPTAQKDREMSRTKKLFINDIIPDSEQPRRDIAKEALEDLVASIEAHGVLQPIVVVRSDGKYKIVAGERRYRAAKQLGHDSIPAIIRTLDHQQQLEVALIENLQREDLNPLEIATALLKLVEQFDVDLETVGKRVGKAPSTVNNTMRLLKLPEPAKRALANKKISEGHARQILALEGNEKKQQELLDLILRHHWSVRKAEQFVTAFKQGSKDTKQAVKKIAEETKETKAIGKKLKAPVRIKRTAKGGFVTIGFKDDKDLERLTKKLAK